MPATGYGGLNVFWVHMWPVSCIKYRRKGACKEEPGFSQRVNAAKMKKTGNCNVWNTAGSFLGLVFLGMIAGLIPVGHELLVRGHYDYDTHAGNTRGSLAANGLQKANQVQAAGGAFETGWRYTKNGWQNRTLWENPASVRKPALHPAIVGAFQALLCMVVLIGFSANKRRLRTGK